MRAAGFLTESQEIARDQQRVSTLSDFQDIARLLVPYPGPGIALLTTAVLPTASVDPVDTDHREFLQRATLDNDQLGSDGDRRGFVLGEYGVYSRQDNGLPRPESLDHVSSHSDGEDK